MKELINDLNNLYKLLKNYYRYKKFKTAYNIAVESLYLIYSDSDSFNFSILHLGIINLDVDYKNDTFVISIFLSRPRIFIGKDGSDYKAYKKILESRLNKTVEIKIIEDRKFA